MAKSIDKNKVPAERSSSKPSIELHDIDLHKVDPQDLSEKISKVAYELFLKRGASHGNDFGDWLEAEQIVLAQMKSEEKK